MSTQLKAGTIYRIHRDPDKTSGAALLRINVLDRDETTLYTVRLSAHPNAVEISKRQLRDAGLPEGLMDAPAKEFEALATPVLDREIVLRVRDVEVPVKDPNTNLVTGTRPGYEATLEPLSRVSASV